MRHEVNVQITGEMRNKKRLLKILEHAKVRFEHIWKFKNEEETECYDISFKIDDKKFGRLYRKMDKLGDLTIS